ncbi:MAG: hypothetical protein AAF384_18980 [Pseudomonadota bacterium]
MEVVLVEFPVGEDAVDDCVAALKQITKDLVMKQPEFFGNTICIERATGTVFNAMRWESADAFVKFRDSNHDQIGPVLCKFNPKPHMLEIAGEYKGAD